MILSRCACRRDPHDERDTFADLEIPAFLKRDPNEPLAPWHQVFPSFTDPATSLPPAEETAIAATKEEIARNDKTRARNRIAKMLGKKETRQAIASGLRWNVKTGLWETPSQPNPPQSGSNT